MSITRLQIPKILKFIVTNYKVQENIFKSRVFNLYKSSKIDNIFLYK